MIKIRKLAKWFLVFASLIISTFVLSTYANGAPVQAPRNISTPSITGTPITGNLLSIAHGKWSGSSIKYSYSWFRCTSPTKSSKVKSAKCKQIPGSFASKLRLTTEDANYYFVSLVTASNRKGVVRIYSTSTSKVALQKTLPTLGLAKPSISSRALERVFAGEEIRVSLGSWTANPVPRVALSSWYSCKDSHPDFSSSLPANCQMIPNLERAQVAVDAFILPTSQRDRYLMFSVAASNSVGVVTAFSPTSKLIETSPTNTSPPNISGNPAVGQTLSLSEGAWHGHGQILEFSTTWYACSNASPQFILEIPLGCNSISAGTSESLEIHPNVLGEHIIVTVNATNNFNETTYSRSNMVGPVLGAPRLDTPPSFQGLVNVGGRVEISGSSWFARPALTSRESSFYLCDSAAPKLPLLECDEIEHARDSLPEAVTLPVGSGGKYLAFIETVTNDVGSASTQILSSPIQSAPVYLEPPTVYGGARVGSTIAADLGTWQNLPQPNLSTTWYRCTNGTNQMTFAIPTGCIESTSFRSFAVHTGGTCFIASDKSVNCLDRVTGLNSKVPNLGDAQVVTSTPSFACALLVAGTISCWGSNYDGQLGDGTRQDSTAPRQVQVDATITKISLGGDTACALTQDGYVYCWGNGRGGQIGHGSSTTSEVPTLARGISNAIDVSVGTGGAGVCAVLTNGTTSCWGNRRLALITRYATNGLRYLEQALEPQKINGISDAKSVSVGTNSACVVTESETVRCWGENSDSQLGNDTAASYNWTRYPADRTTSYPVTVRNLSGVRSVHAGDTSCAVLIQGETFCWGWGAVTIGYGANQGLTGTGGATGSDVPQGISTTSGTQAISVEGHKVCVLDSEGQIKCRGCGYLRMSPQYSCSDVLVPIDSDLRVPPRYELTREDLGQLVAVAVEAQNENGSQVYVPPTTEKIKAIALWANLPEIMGTNVGDELSFSVSDSREYPGSQETYQWFRCYQGDYIGSDLYGDIKSTTELCAPIEGETSYTYITKHSDVGSFVTLEITRTNPIGSSTTVARKVGRIASGPYVENPPTVTRQYSQDNGYKFFTGNVGSWRSYPKAKLTGIWYRCVEPVLETASSLPSTCEEIPDTRAPNLTSVSKRVLKNEDLGFYLSFSVIGQVDGWAEKQVWSVSTDVVVP